MTFADCPVKGPFSYIFNALCEENGKFPLKVIDEFLLYQAAKRNNLEYEMNQEYVVCKHITLKFQ